jgi:serine/threonine protein kinase
MNGEDLQQQWQIQENMISVPTQRLGSGKFGRVFEILFQDKPVALKRMKHGIDAVFFFNEIRILSLLQHDNIPILYGYIHSEHKMGILMEKVDGISLFHFVCFHEFGYKTMLYISKQIISTLRYIHSRNILYRDVKTENIMIHPRTCHVHFVDFGLAHLLQSPTDVVQGICGTPGYMAPEIMENKYYGLASDIFSCGVVLYVLSTNHDPSTPRKMRRRLYLQVRPPLRTMIIKCLSYHPKKRPALYEMESQLVEMMDNPTISKSAFLCFMCKA